jgi:hypothetical protein
MQSRSPDRYKRRFLVEFTPNESDLLDRLGLTRGTKRRAILDGLRLLESGELETLRGSVAELERERDAAAAEAAVTAAQLAEGGTLRDELTATTSQLRDERGALKLARAGLRQAKQDLASARQDLAAAQAEGRRLEALVPHYAFCAACRKFVPEAEWAEQPVEKGGVHVYHKRHGYRPKPTFAENYSLLFWRSTPSAPEVAK